MKRSLYVKFIIAYGIFAILAFFIAAALGSQFIEDNLVQNTADRLYTEATQISSRANSYFSKTSSLEDLYSSLKIVASSQDAQIRIITADGTVLINTDTALKTDNPDQIKDFNYAAFGPRYYEISTFYKQFDNDTLSVMVPVASSLTTKGFVSLHVPMTVIEAQRGQLLLDFFIITAIVVILSSAILLLFTFAVYKPVKMITQGAREIAAGHLDYRIEVPSDDEIGMLADSLNNMAADLQKTGDYQKKFISNVSHDFRSPLTSIKGFTEAMTDGTIPPEMHEKYLKIISSEADRLEKLTRNTLTLNNLDSRETKLEKSIFDINAVIKNTAAVFEGSCRKKKISFDLVLQGESLKVNADKGKIEQVLYNLIDNAVKFSERNTTIHLETSVRHGKCEVKVEDEGCGISPDELSKIWDRFYKADASRGKDKKGTGLGLSIVKEIINAHNQTITASSTENVGTRFLFTLELAKQ